MVAVLGWIRPLDSISTENLTVVLTRSLSVRGDSRDRGRSSLTSLIDAAIDFLENTTNLVEGLVGRGHGRDSLRHDGAIGHEEGRLWRCAKMSDRWNRIFGLA